MPSPSRPLCASCGKGLIAQCGSQEHLRQITHERRQVARRMGEFVPCKKSPVGFGLSLAIGDVCFECAEKAAVARQRASRRKERVQHEY
jgi:hypothetical protein